MDRRTFLSGAAQRVVIVTLAFVATGSVVITSTEIANHLRDAFPYLRIPARDLEEFSQAYLGAYGRPSAGQWGHIEQTFLLSTDFFPNGADEARPVRFLRIYHPYVSLCFNPLADAGR